MKLLRRQFLHLAAGAAAMPVVSRIAGAQTYPSRAITILVPAAAGGSMDTIGRLIVQPLRTSLGEPASGQIRPSSAAAHDERSAFGSG
jgi:tripartite-type tricarboxylate transporter receptor subunit TctC